MVGQDAGARVLLRAIVALEALGLVGLTTRDVVTLGDVAGRAWMLGLALWLLTKLRRRAI